MPKRGYKTSGHFAIPQNLTPADRVCFCINLPADSEHLGVFWGALNRLGWRALWGEPLTAESEIVAAYWQQILDDNRECFEDVLQMANKGCGEQTPQGQRVRQDGLYEETFNGIDWSLVTNDPRLMGMILAPPPPGPPSDQKRCNAAESARTILKAASEEVLNNIDAWASMSSVILAITAFLAEYLGQVGLILSALALAIAYAVYLLGRAALLAALTDEVWDTLMCIFYCNFEQDGSCTEQGWQQIKQDVFEQIGGIAEVWLWNIVNGLGPIGLTNAGWLNPGAVGDCAACVCPEACTNTPIINVNYGGQNLTQIDATTWQIESVAWDFNPDWQIAAIIFSESGLACCELGAQSPISGVPNVYELADCDGNYATGGWPIPNGCYRDIRWENRFGAPFIIQFNLGECPP